MTGRHQHDQHGEHQHGDPSHHGEERVVVRDRRRIDPLTGQVRPPVVEEPQVDPDAPSGRHAAEETPVTSPSTNGVPEPIAETDDWDELRKQLDERTADLQRLTAEYANYRKRVDRDREAVAIQSKAHLVGELLAVLDDLERAGAHGDLTGAFKSVADRLVGTLQRAGLEPFGQDGEPFDPSVHEAVQHTTSPDVSGPTVTAVLRRGYRFGDRVLRAALVAVTDHESVAAEEQPADEQIVDPTPPADQG